MPEEPTKVMPAARVSGDFRDFLDRHEVKLVQVSGDMAGLQFRLEQETCTLGRGAEADLTVESEAASRRHAAIEFADGQYRIRDLGSTNGVYLNGEIIQIAELRHGDRIDIGGQVFQFLCDAREVQPETYQIDDDG
jgi:pSer/pThr/pTyr-binding forkhead associated (FHA) protein